MLNWRNHSSYWSSKNNNKKRKNDQRYLKRHVACAWSNYNFIARTHVQQRAIIPSCLSVASPLKSTYTATLMHSATSRAYCAPNNRSYYQSSKRFRHVRPGLTVPTTTATIVINDAKLDPSRFNFFRKPLNGLTHRRRVLSSSRLNLLRPRRFIHGSRNSLDVRIVQLD